LLPFSGYFYVSDEIERDAHHQNGMERFFTTLRDNTRHNAFWLYLDGIFFGLGYAAFFPYTILPGFVTHFSRNPIVINGVVALFALGLQGTQLLACWLYDSRRQKTGIFLKWSMGFRIAATPLFLLAFFSGQLSGWLLPLFFIVFGIMVSAWGLSSPLWIDLVGRWVEDSRRSRFLGIRIFASQMAFIIGGVIVMTVLGSAAFPMNYAFVFLTGAFFWWGSHLALCYLKEARYPITNPPYGIQDFLGEMADIFRKDAAFRFLVLAFLLSSAHAMSTALYTTVSLDRFYGGAASAARDQYIGQCSLVFNMSAAIAALTAVWLMRRRSNWFVLVAGYLCFALAAFNACFALSPQSFAGTFILNGVFIGFDAVAGTDLLLRLTPVEHRLRYIGLANTARGIASAFFPFLGGILMKNWGATVTFLATAIVGVFASSVLYAGAPKSRTAPTSGL
jgi:MFS family permease